MVRVRVRRRARNVHPGLAWPWPGLAWPQPDLMTWPGLAWPDPRTDAQPRHVEGVSAGGGSARYRLELQVTWLGLGWGSRAGARAHVCAAGGASRVSRSHVGRSGHGVHGSSSVACGLPSRRPTSRRPPPSTHLPPPTSLRPTSLRPTPSPPSLHPPFSPLHLRSRCSSPLDPVPPVDRLATSRSRRSLGLGLGRVRSVGQGTGEQRLDGLLVRVGLG